MNSNRPYNLSKKNKNKKISTECASSNKTTETPSASAKQVQPSEEETRVPAPPLLSAVSVSTTAWHLAAALRITPDDLEVNKPKLRCLEND